MNSKLARQCAKDDERLEQAIQGLAQDMWLRMESEAKLTWSGLSEYRTALEGSARTSDDMRMNSHQEVRMTDPFSSSTEPTRHSSSLHDTLRPCYAVCCVQLSHELRKLRFRDVLTPASVGDSVPGGWPTGARV